jgi:uncharacterized membrane protein
MYSGPRLSSPTVLGIDERIERVLCYVLGWITGLIFLVIEQKNQNVRRHAWQSLIVFGSLSLIAAVIGLFGGVLGAIPLIGALFHLIFGLIGGIIWFVTVLAWVLLIIAAFLSPETFISGPRRRYV